ncbi:phosphopantothenoylcysteine decarboxylase domain-containing protein [Tautonia marina]|uniref:phosphopantothenoylcysteine decarboxylase domain-containing protein n=1 Tax=Tautonia marina TaxID=2653855 RepID=UPI001F1FF000|nr:phosphopantothenoylcysteine decarboxylase [Tautonia marina]
MSEADGSRPLNVVVTGGGTIAPIDDVRHIANASTGRFSAAITEAWLDQGATVWHVHAPTAELPIRRHLNAIDLARPAEKLRQSLDALADRWKSQQDRLHLVPLARGTVSDYAETLERIVRAGPADVVMLAMAVSDYEPMVRSGKIGSEADLLTLHCRKTPKVIQAVRDWAPDAYLVGFKLLSGAEPSELIRTAERACRINRTDLTVANDLRSYRAGRHTIVLVRPDAPVETLGPEDGDRARLLVDRVARWAGHLGERRSAT